MGRIKKANSKKLTGEEVGRLLLKNTIHTYKQSIVGKDPKPILSQKEFDKMVGEVDFTEARNRDMYSRYVSLDNWTSKYLSILNTIYSDARSEIKTLLIYINGMLLVQDSLLIYYSIPLVEEKEEFEKNTDFAEKKFKQLDEQSGVLSILKNNGENIVFEIVQESVQSIVEYYQHLIAYDRTIEIIADSLEIPEYTIFKRGAEDIYEGYKVVKDLMSSLEKKVKATYSANPSQAHIRLEALKIAFKDFDLEGYKIPEEAQKKLEMELRADLTAFKKHGNGVGQSSKLYQRLTPIKEGVEDE
ncbi:MAG: hypothetical protein EOM41_10580 [Bacilli bacterium]|nr:hypothetical protein [Bacilli bacterium]